MRPTKITVSTESSGRGCILANGADTSLLKMARHDGKHLPLLLQVEFLQVLSEYRDFEQCKKGTRFDKYLFKKSS